MATLDQDDPVDSSDDSGDDSDDDTAVLMAELSKIKAEKARDEAERDAGKKEEEEQIRMENILSGKLSSSCEQPKLSYLYGGNTLLFPLNL